MLPVSGQEKHIYSLPQPIHLGTVAGMPRGHANQLWSALAIILELAILDVDAKSGKWQKHTFQGVTRHSTARIFKHFLDWHSSVQHGFGRRADRHGLARHGSFDRPDFRSEFRPDFRPELRSGFLPDYRQDFRSDRSSVGFTRNSFRKSDLP